MCYYSQLIKNPKYKKTKKNGGIVPPITDQRVTYVPIGCGKCMECRAKKAREWQVRLLEDIKHHKNGKFITLTFSNESYTKLWKELEPKGYQGYDLDNQIATLASRRFLERWRKTFKKSLRHWYVTELGQTGTEHLHLHGIVWTNETMETVEAHWQYGWIWKGKMVKGRLINYVNEATVNYTIKYVNKADEKHPNYRSIILTSPGIGANYKLTGNAKKNQYHSEKTDETYKTRSGHKMGLPIYWRNHLYTEEEREKLWLKKLDEGYRWIGGEKVKANDTKTTMALLKYYQDKNTRLGYGSDKIEWEQKIYENQLRTLKQMERAKKKQDT